MRIQKSYEYAATPEAVFAMLADPAFQAAKCEATHPLSHIESVTPKGEQTEILTRRVVSTDGFPDFAKSMIGPKLAITETVIWSRASMDGSRTGTMVIGIGDAPVGMQGTITMMPGGEGTRIEIDGELKARIPLLSGTIEKTAEPWVVAAVDKEQEVGRAWLVR
ncbi:MAG: DUF2505 domain-containing protein [Actinomycetota bacterium]|nr:DUF2505 domain-containing protein [Actinomycetota bacterium]